MAETMESAIQECPKLQAFKSIRKNFALMGISPKLATQPFPLNGEIFMNFLVFCSWIIFICVYISNEEQTLFELTQSIYIGSVGFLVVLALLILIFKVEQLFEYINRTEDMLNMSKWMVFQTEELLFK